VRVLFLDLDTLRPDHLGCYGYPRATSPTIDRIAAAGMRFDRYYCSDAPCLPSRAALVSGRFGITSGVVGHGGTAADMRLEGASRGFRTAFSQQDSLWQLFRRKGLWTASVSPFAERHSAWWFHSGFNETINPGKGGMESAEEVTPWALDWIERNAARDDWLLHVNYWDPHTPYRAPASFGNPFAGDPLPAWWNEEILARHRGQPGGHGSREVGMWDSAPHPQWPRHPSEIASPADYRRMIDGYDCGVRYMDEHIGRLLEALERKGVMDDLAIIVTSDHGENLGELNCYGEHGTADEITHRIPMILRMPGCPRGVVDGGLHYSLDLAPTLAELWGLPASPRWQGRSFAASLARGEDCGRGHLVLSQCCHGAMRSVRFGPWLFMRVYHDFYHLYPPQMLFDVERDPHETEDLAARRPEICAEGARLLESWHAEMMAGMPDAVDPLWTVMREGGPFHSRGALSAYCSRLESSGRAAAAAALRSRHPEEI
jgi:choline-sulfatase